MKKLIGCSLLAIILSPLASAETVCGGDFNQFKEGLRAEARTIGISDQAIESVLSLSSAPLQSILDLDRKQNVFKMFFTDFATRVIRQDRIDNGALKLKNLKQIFDTAEATYGVPREVITAFWALETDFGGNQGSEPTAQALITLAHDCRRPELFRPHIFGLMKLSQKGDLNPATTVGAWAGEIGQVQMLPADIIKYGVDGDGDNHTDLRNSAADAILSAANVMKAHGWVKGKPWVQEVIIDEADVDKKEIWAFSGLASSLPVKHWRGLGVKVRQPDFKYKADQDDLASLVAPEGRRGPKFFIYYNFSNVFLKWNQSFTYTLSASQLANRLAGGFDFLKDQNMVSLNDSEIKDLQQRLTSMGYDVGKIDGIIGGGTRQAVKFEQLRLGMVSDGWPTRELLDKL